MTETGLRMNGGGRQTAATQPGLPLLVSQRTVFLPVDAVRAKFGCDAESVFAMVDNGELRWAFNLGIDGKRAEWRFWTREIIAPETTKDVELPQVLASILGAHKFELRRGEIERQWIVSAQHVMRLVKAGWLELSRPGHVTRASAAAFLKGRAL